MPDSCDDDTGESRDDPRSVPIDVFFRHELDKGSANNRGPRRDAANQRDHLLIANATRCGQ